MDQPMQPLKSQDQIIEETRATLKALTDHIERLSSVTSTLIVTLKRADATGANGRLQTQATVNKINADLARMLSIIVQPHALAAMVSRSDLDEARNIKRHTSIAMTGKDPMKDRRSPDEITLVAVRVHGVRKSFRLTKKTALALCSALGSVGGFLIRHFIHW